ncbi:MAG: response regulator transcription factor [Turicibacter sp.]|nr:response regulator transcription factor [Turicibacter sp.]
MKKILIIEDEISIQQLLKNFLEDAGYGVTIASDGLEGIETFQESSFDLILLDVMLPKIDGYAVLEMIRKTSNIPVIMITALDEEKNQLQAFELEVDDFIVKPFTMALALKRIEAVLRRTQSADQQQDETILSHKELTLNTTTGEVFQHGKPIFLTQKEYELLKLFLENHNRLFTREYLLETLWGYDFFGDPKIVNFHVQNLRRKLGGDHIETVRGMGYKLR